MQAYFLQADVTSPDDCIAMLDTAVSQFGRLDIACNNAGANTIPTPTTETDLDNWRKFIDVNLSGGFLLPARADWQVHLNTKDVAGEFGGDASVV